MSIDRALQVSSIVISLISAGLVAFYPVRWVGLWSIALAALVVFAAIIWTIASRNAVKEYKARQPFSSSALAQAAETGLDKHESKAKRPSPVFVPTANTRIVKYGFDVNSQTLEREPYYEHNLVNVALAQFLYKPDEGVESYLIVAAHVILHRPDGTRIQPEIYNPVWDADDLKTIKEFHAGRVHDLIIALFSLIDANSIVLYEHDPKGDQSPWDVLFTPKVYEVEGDEFFVNVHLILKRFANDPLPKQSFWFRLTTEPKAEFKVIDSPDFAA